MIDDYGGHLNVLEEPELRFSIAHIHLRTEEAHIPSNVDED